MSGRLRSLNLSRCASVSLGVAVTPELSRAGLTRRYFAALFTLLLVPVRAIVPGSPVDRILRCPSTSFSSLHETGRIGGILGSSIGKSLEESESLPNDYAESFESIKNSTEGQMRKSNTSTPSSSKFAQKKSNFVNMNLDLDAPQWADFISASPQVSYDDYFSRKHDENEYREKDNFNLSVNSSMSDTPCKDKENFNFTVNASLKETTYENVLTEAMNNLQMSVKMKPGDKSINKLCLVESPAVKTMNKRFTRSMCSQIEKSVKFKDQGNKEENKENSSITRCLTPANKSKRTRPLSTPHVNKEHKSPESDKSLHNSDSQDSPLTDQSFQLNLEVTATSTEHEVSEEKNEMHEISEEKNEFSEEKHEFSEEKYETSEEKYEISEEKFEFDLEVVKENENDQENENEINVNQEENANVPKSKVVTSFATQQTVSNNLSKKKATALTGTAWHRQVKRRMSLSNQNRLSLSKSKPVGSTKYVSMAEAVSKFQRSTPQRFHSNSKKTTKTEQLRRMSFKLTRATSPALMCKSRARPVTAISREEQENLELEKIRQNQIKANPVRKDILKKAAPLKKVEKKMVTNPEPFHLTETKKNQSTLKPMQEVKRVHTKKLVPSIVSIDEEGVVVKDEEVLYFGIPCNTKKKNTKVMPFSFEARNKELQMKKQEKLKKMQETAQQQNKAEFHARPVPAAVKTPINKQPVKNTVPKVTVPRSLSFEQRHKEMQKKKEEKIKQILEEEKQTRTFRAQKVPEFKPVMVRGRSRDNLKKSHENLSVKSDSAKEMKTNSSFKRSQESLTAKSHNESASKASALKRSQENLVKPKNLIKKPLSLPMVATKKLNPPTTAVKTTPKPTNAVQGTAPKILEPKCKLSQKSVAVLSELNTDKRAKQRKEFDEHLKKKEMSEQEMRKKDEEDRIAKEKAEQLELRKRTEIKARPMPVYKPMQVVKSSKPLTDAHSPAWANRKGSTH